METACEKILIKGIWPGLRIDSLERPPLNFVNEQAMY